MRAWLAKRWFLLLLAGGATLALLRPRALDWIDALDPRGVVALALFLMAWIMPGRQLLGVLARPWPALWALVLSAGAVPATAFLLMPLLPTAFGIGLLLIASVPCTLASAVLWTRRAGGDEAVVLVVILLTTSTSWLTTTAWLSFGTGTALEIDAAAMMLDLLLLLVGPVGLGQACRSLGPLARAAQRGRTVWGVVAQLLILAILLKATVKIGERLAVESDPALAWWAVATAGLCLGLHLAALLAGLWSSALLGFARPQRIAVAFACSQKTLPVAMLLFERYFQAYPLAVLPLAFYHFGQLIVDTFVADALARSAIPVDPGKESPVITIEMLPDRLG